MSKLRESKQLLNRLGGYLSEEINVTGNQELREAMRLLKEVNVKINNAMNGVSSNGGFSFDDEMTESVQRPQRRMTEESEMDFGVDLGGFNSFVNQKSPEQEAGYDWKQTFREANSGECGGVDVGGFNPNAEVYSDTLGRIIDET